MYILLVLRTVFIHVRCVQESALHKRSHTHTLRCPIANKVLASMGFRHKAPTESFHVDLGIAQAVLVREVIVITFQDEACAPKVHRTRKYGHTAASKSPYRSSCY